VCNDGDVYQLYKSKLVRAAKPHKCEECYSEIKIGDKYWFATGLFDGEWNSHHTCEMCMAIWDGIDVQGHKCILHGGLYEYIHATENDYGPLNFVLIDSTTAECMREEWMEEV
jgi:hypothetical protein